MNGYPLANAYGWGGEDDALRRRAASAGVPIERNTTVGSYIDLEYKSVPQKLAWLALHKEYKNTRKWELRDHHDETWASDGLNGPRRATVLQHTLRRPGRSLAAYHTYDHLLVDVPTVGLTL